MESISFKEFLSANKIINFTIQRNSNTITCENNEGSVTVINIGRKYQAVEINELLSDGFVLIDGYQGKNWIWVANENFGFETIEIDLELLKNVREFE